jgi:hypothetical protein
MSNNTEPASAASRSRLRRAEHAGGAYDADIAACVTVAAAGGALHYVAHITSGVFDFAFETLGNRPHGDEQGKAFDRAGRQLSLAVAQLNATCKRLDSGALVRVVIQGESGALFQCLKLPGQAFVGLTLSGATDTIDEADRQMVELSETVAYRTGSASSNWVGPGSRKAAAEARKVHEPEPSTQAKVSPHISASEHSVPDSVIQTCLAALAPTHLHYLAIYRYGQEVWCADIFDHPDLAALFQRVTPESRRSGYAKLIMQVQLQSRRFRQLLEVVRSERLIRLVLHVPRGVTYVLPLSEDDYLVGVTLNHSRLKRADRQVQALHEKIHVAWTPTAAPGRDGQ